MYILKFGGTSLGSPERMQSLIPIVASYLEKGEVYLVLSAVSGTTNDLASINNDWSNNSEDAILTYFKLRYEYEQYINSLFSEEEKESVWAKLDEHFIQLRMLINGEYSDEKSKIVLAIGEQLSTLIFHEMWKLYQKDSILLDAFELIIKNQNGEPDLPLIQSRIRKCHIPKNPSLKIIQGYICTNHLGKVDNLERGGSDYTATILGNVLAAEEVIIWTDIDGMHNNDPRVVEQTTPVRVLSYQEASELAYFGAKILHPSCITPAREANVPVRLKYTFDPQAEGTLISEKSSGKTVTAIAAKDQITAIKIRSGRMLNAHGFLLKVFEVFEKYSTAVDMITTSEVSVSLTIDDDTHLLDIIKDLVPYGDISFDKDQSIICIVGDRLSEYPQAISTIVSATNAHPIRMISYGGSLNNISLLVDTQHKNSTLNNLHWALFDEQIAQVSSIN